MQHLKSALKYVPVVMLKYVREVDVKLVVILNVELTLTTGGMFTPIKAVIVCGVNEGEMGRFELKAM